MSDSTTISPDGEYIEINVAERSVDAANHPMFHTSSLVAERVTYGNTERQDVRVAVEDFDAASIVLSVEQAAELRDWLIKLNLG